MFFHFRLLFTVFSFWPRNDLCCPSKNRAPELCSFCFKSRFVTGKGCEGISSFLSRFLSSRGLLKKKKKTYRSFKVIFLGRLLKCRYPRQFACERRFCHRVFAIVFAEAALIQMEAGNQALKAVFNSKLVGKGKYLTEHLQPHSTGMRAHKIYYAVIRRE